MTNTKKTGTRALAWVLALAMLVLSIPVMAITAGAEEVKNLIVNGDFSKGTEGWSGIGNMSVNDAGQITFTCGHNTKPGDGIYQVVTGLQVGKEYILTAEKYSNTQVRVYADFGSTPSTTLTNKLGDDVLENVTKIERTFEATDSTVRIAFYRSDKAIILDNISLVAVGGEEGSHTITLNQPTGGTISANPATAAAGTEVTLTAMPNFGYEFESWNVIDGEGNPVTLTNNTFVMPDSDVTVSATFEPEAGEGDGPFTVTFSGTYGEGNKITDISNLPKAQTYKKGTEVTLTLDYGKVYKPQQDHDFSLVTAKADNKEIPSKVQIGELKNNSADVTVTFTFPVVKNLAIVINSPDSTQPTVTVTEGIVVSNITLTQPTEGGEISAQVAGVDVTEAAAGDEVTLTATPDEDYEFVAWNVTGATVENKNPATFTMPKNAVSVSATFRSTAAETYAVTIDENIENGSISANPETAEENETVTLTATPNTGYELATVTVKQTDDAGTVDAIIDGNTATFEMPAYAVTVSATFALIDYTVTVTGGTAEIGDTTIVTAHYQDVVTLVLDENAIPAGKEFAKWVSADVEITDNTFTMPAKDVTVTAKYRVKGNLLQNPEFDGGLNDKDFGWGVSNKEIAVCGDGSITFKCGRNGNTGDGLYQQVSGLLPGVKYVFTVKNGADSKDDARLFIGSTIDTTKAPIETIAKGDTLEYGFTAETDTLEILFYGYDHIYTLSELSLVPKYAPETLEDVKYSAALVLHNDININLQMECKDDGFDSTKVRVYVDKNKVTLTPNDNGKVLTGTLAEVQPDEMAVEHNIMVVYGDVVVKEFTYSVRKYCDAVFKMCGEETGDPLYQLCEAVLNYGAWVDRYVNKKDTSEINKDHVINTFDPVDDTQVVAVEDRIATGGCITGACACSLKLGSTITMNFFVTTGEEMPNPEKDILILNNEGNRVDPENITVEIDESDTYNYVISVKNISASKLSRSYKLMFMKDMNAVYVDGESIKQVAEKTESYLQYSVYTYCSDVLAQETDDEVYTETLQTLCSALANYGEVAKAYEDSKKVVK